MVTIGPKYYRSVLPVGKVDLETVYPKIALADQCRLGQQMYTFNLLTHYEGNDSHYVGVYVINGHCRYKRYTFLDLLLYKVSQLFLGQRSKSRAARG
jgi:hypothetical protein